MCKNCKGSELGIARQADLDAALADCQRIDINPGIHGFLTRNAWKNYTPQYTDEQRAVLDRYNVAAQAMKKLHEDYVWDLGRKAVAAEKARRGIQA